jgi:TPR repeat protein
MEEKNDAAHYFADQIAAAKLGDMYAQNNIGYFYLTGEKGFLLDLLQAKGWLTLAANQGFQHSKDKLALVEAKLAEQSANKKAR